MLPVDLNGPSKRYGKARGFSRGTRDMIVCNPEGRNIARETLKLVRLGIAVAALGAENRRCEESRNARRGRKSSDGVDPKEWISLGLAHLQMYEPISQSLWALVYLLSFIRNNAKKKKKKKKKMQTRTRANTWLRINPLMATVT